jgi:type I restriction enzyme R subunit
MPLREATRPLLPDVRAEPHLKRVAVLHVLAEAIRGRLGPVDISAVSAKIEVLLDERVESFAITAPIITGDGRDGRVDLSHIDFAKLAKLFAQKPHTAADKLRDVAEKKVRELTSQNPTRAHLVEKLESWSRPTISRAK